MTNTDFGLRSLQVKGPKVWNALPSSIKNEGNVVKFKKNVKDFLLYHDLPL